MINKKWFAGALLGAFLSITAIGSPQAEAGVLTTDIKPMRSDIVIVVDPFHDRWDRHPAPPPPHHRYDRHPPHHRHGTPPPHHRHPRPHHR